MNGAIYEIKSLQGCHLLALQTNSIGQTRGFLVSGLPITATKNDIITPDDMVIHRDVIATVNREELGEQSFKRILSVQELRMCITGEIPSELKDYKKGYQPDLTPYVLGIQRHLNKLTAQALLTWEKEGDEKSND